MSMLRPTPLLIALVLLSAASVSALTPTNTTVTFDRTTATYGETLLYAVKVEAPSGSPGGVATLWVDGVRYGPISIYEGMGVQHNVVAFSYTTTLTLSLPAGTHSLYVEYAGDGTFQPSASPTVTVTVKKAATYIEYKPRSLYYIGGPSRLTFRIRVAGADSFSATGDVRVAEGDTVLLDDSASWYDTVNLDKLPAGEHEILISYPGSANLEPVIETVKVSVLLPSLSIQGTQVVEGNDGTKTVMALVTLSVPVTVPVRVAFNTVGGSASEGSDFAGASGVLEFGPREQVKVIPLTIFGDGVSEGDESFSVVLSDPINASFEKSSAQVVIANDDAPAPSRRRPSRP